MIQINTFNTLQNIADYYYVNKSGEIINIKNNIVKKQTKGKRGYLYVTLQTRNGKAIKVYVHKIIALSYIKNCDYECINHKDGNKLNNHISNLEFSTIKENTIHAWKIGLISRAENLYKCETFSGMVYIDTIKNLNLRLSIPKYVLYNLERSKIPSVKWDIKSIYKIEVKRLSK